MGSRTKASAPFAAFRIRCCTSARTRWPLAQNGRSWEYLLPDALGSVRQIVDTNGNVTLAESYEPYGTVLTSTGTASSIFGYAGEQADTSGLIYLRARRLPH